MIMSPDELKQMYEGYKVKPYEELLKVREHLLELICAYENHTYNPIMDTMEAPLSHIYQCNLETLGILCISIAEKFCEEKTTVKPEFSFSDVFAGTAETAENTETD